MPHRSVFRLRLRTFLVLITVNALVLGDYLGRQRREWRRLRMREEIGVTSWIVRRFVSGPRDW